MVGIKQELFNRDLREEMKEGDPTQYCMRKDVDPPGVPWL